MMGFNELMTILGTMTLGYAIGRISEHFLIGKKEKKWIHKNIQTHY